MFLIVQISWIGWMIRSRREFKDAFQDVFLVGDSRIKSCEYFDVSWYGWLINGVEFFHQSMYLLVCDSKYLHVLLDHFFSSFLSSVFTSSSVLSLFISCTVSLGHFTSFTLVICSIVLVKPNSVTVFVMMTEFWWSLVRLLNSLMLVYKYRWSWTEWLWSCVATEVTIRLQTLFGTYMG